MKIVLSLLVLILNVSLIFAQDEKPSLTITGTVKEIAMQETNPNTSSSLFITYIKLNLSLKNTNSIPIIFLQDEPIVYYAEVSQIEKGNNVFLAKTDGASSSYMMSAGEWRKLKTTLDKPNPPKKKTRVVHPNETIEFERFVRFKIPKSQDYPQPGVFRETFTLDFIQKHSPAQIKIRFETWHTLSLIEKSTKQKKTDFADKLRNKWKNFGYLWTKEIEAQPISIDFNSVIFKTLLN